MTRVIYIVGRIDGTPSIHMLQFIRETEDRQMQRFVSTSNLASAKKFKNVIEAMRFLSTVNPSNKRPDEKTKLVAPYCYEILILDGAALKLAMSRGFSPQALKGTPDCAKVFCSTQVAERPLNGFPALR